MRIIEDQPLSEAARRVARRLGRDWPVGSRLPSVRDLARQLQVANATAHRAVKELTAMGLLVTRPRSGVFVAATPAPNIGEKAGELAARHIAIFRVDRPGEDLIVRMVSGVQREIEPYGCRVSIHPLTDELARVPRDADAVVLFNPNKAPALAERQALAIVTTRDRVDLPRTHGYDVVSIEQEQGGMIAAEALRAAGGLRACFVGRGVTGDVEHAGPPLDSTSQRRVDGFIQGWGGDPEAVTVLHTGSYGQLSGGFAVRKFVKLSPRPDAVFCASDEIAMGFMAGAAAVGLMAGRDYLLVGFDGQRLGQEQFPAPLTTVEVPAHEMGRRAAQLLIDRLRHPRQPVRRVSLGCDLLPGSTAPRKEGQ